MYAACYTLDMIVAGSQDYSGDLSRLTNTSLYSDGLGGVAHANICTSVRESYLSTAHCCLSSLEVGFAKPVRSSGRVLNNAVRTLTGTVSWLFIGVSETPHYLRQEVHRPPFEVSQKSHHHRGTPPLHNNVLLSP